MEFLSSILSSVLGCFPLLLNINKHKESLCFSSIAHPRMFGTEWDHRKKKERERDTNNPTPWLQEKTLRKSNHLGAGFAFKKQNGVLQSLTVNLCIRIYNKVCPSSCVLQESYYTESKAALDLASDCSVFRHPGNIFFLSSTGSLLPEICVSPPPPPPFYQLGIEYRNKPGMKPAVE